MVSFNSNWISETVSRLGRVMRARQLGVFLGCNEPLEMENKADVAGSSFGELQQKQQIDYTLVDAITAKGRTTCLKFLTSFQLLSDAVTQQMR